MEQLPRVGISEVTMRKQSDGTFTGTVTFDPADHLEAARLARFHLHLSSGQQYQLRQFDGVFVDSPAPETETPRPYDATEITKQMTVRFVDPGSVEVVMAPFGVVEPVTYVWREVGGRLDSVYPSTRAREV